MAATRPGSVSSPAATSPTTIISQVTAFGLSPVRSSRRVTTGDTRRMYSLPAQCSPLLRSNRDGGWVAARSSATEGVGERTDTRPRLLLVHREVLQDGEAIRAGGRRVEEGLDELVLREAEIVRRARKRVSCEARVDLLGEALVLVQVAGEEGRGACQLAVPRRAGEEVVDGMDDLVVAPAARPARARGGRREAAQDEALGECDQELLVVDAVLAVDDAHRGGAGEGDRHAVDPFLALLLRKAPVLDRGEVADG